MLESANRYYQNAAKLSGTVNFAGKLTPQARTEMDAEIAEKYGGAKNAGRIAIIDQGGDFKNMEGTNARDAQILEAMDLSVGDVGRITSLSPIQLGDFSSAHYNSLVADQTAFYQQSMRPLCDSIEQEFNFKIFGNQSDYCCKFDVDELLRGDRQTQVAVNTAEIQAGYLTRNEARLAVGYPPRADMEGALSPINMGGNPTTSTVKDPPDIPPAKEQDSEQSDKEASNDEKDTPDNASDK